MPGTQTLENATDLMVLRRFFGYRPGGNLKDFQSEIKELSPAEKKEMADLARLEPPEMWDNPFVN